MIKKVQGLLSNIPKKDFVRKSPSSQVTHHSGKGTRSRLNTAAEKNMFNSKLSK